MPVEPAEVAALGGGGDAAAAARGGHHLQLPYLQRLGVGHEVAVTTIPQIRAPCIHPSSAVCGPDCLVCPCPCRPCTRGRTVGNVPPSRWGSEQPEAEARPASWRQGPPSSAPRRGEGRGASRVLAQLPPPPPPARRPLAPLAGRGDRNADGGRGEPACPPADGAAASAQRPAVPAAEPAVAAQRVLCSGAAVARQCDIALLRAVQTYTRGNPWVCWAGCPTCPFKNWSAVLDLLRTSGHHHAHQFFSANNRKAGKRFRVLLNAATAPPPPSAQRRKRRRADAQVAALMRELVEEFANPHWECCS